MSYDNYENNLLSILSFASTRATWVSVGSCAERCGSGTGVDYNIVYKYFLRDEFGQVADYYRYDYRLRKRRETFYISAVSRGYA